MESSVLEAGGARRAAIEELERMLRTPEDLKRLPILMQESTAAQESSSSALGADVSDMVANLRNGRVGLAEAAAALKRLKVGLREVVSLCDNAGRAIDAPGPTYRLELARANLHRTLADVERIAALPREAAAAEELLEDDSKIRLAHLSLTLLEGTATTARAALWYPTDGGGGWDESGGDGTGQVARPSRNIDLYFTKVQRALGRLEDRLWSIMRRYLELSREDPALLISALSVVELQERVDAGLAAAEAREKQERLRPPSGPPGRPAPSGRAGRSPSPGKRGAGGRSGKGGAGSGVGGEGSGGTGGGSPPRGRGGGGDARRGGDQGAASAAPAAAPSAYPPRKRWKARAMEHISSAAQERFAPLLQQCSRLGQEGEDAAAEVEAVLAEAGRSLDELDEVRSRVAACFPPHYDISRVVAELTREHLDATIDCVGLCADALASADLLRVVRWTREYRARIRGHLGSVGRPPATSASAPPPGDSRETPPDAKVTAVYVSRTKSNLAAWLRNVLDADGAADPEARADGTAWRPSTVDLLRGLNENVAAVAEVSDGPVLQRVGIIALETLAAYARGRAEAVGLAVRDRADLEPGAAAARPAEVLADGDRGGGSGGTDADGSGDDPADGAGVDGAPASAGDTAARRPATGGSGRRPSSAPAPPPPPSLADLAATANDSRWCQRECLELQESLSRSLAPSLRARVRSDGTAAVFARLAADSIEAMVRATLEDPGLAGLFAAVGGAPGHDGTQAGAKAAARRAEARRQARARWERDMAAWERERERRRRLESGESLGDDDEDDVDSALGGAAAAAGAAPAAPSAAPRRRYARPRVDDLPPLPPAPAPPPEDPHMGSDPWVTGLAVGSLVATLDDFLQDLMALLEKPLAERALAALARETSARYCAALLAHARRGDEDAVAACRRDAARLAAFFSAKGSGDTACSRLAAPINLLADCLAARGPAELARAYAALLERAPELGPDSLRGVLGARARAFADADLAVVGKGAEATAAEVAAASAAAAVAATEDQLALRSVWEARPSKMGTAGLALATGAEMGAPALSMRGAHDVPGGPAHVDASPLEEEALWGFMRARPGGRGETGDAWL